MQTMMAFPGEVLMEYNLGERPVPYPITEGAPAPHSGGSMDR
jgi:hypothetical protein